jgi:hypothetical protein
MHDYVGLRRTHGRQVSQTIDSPIMLFDWFELSDAFAVLGIVLVLGVLLYAWIAMLVGLVIVIGIVPVIRHKNDPGVFLHWPYKTFGMSLPGIMNPGGESRYSD